MGFKGRTHSEAAKKKISDSRKNYKGENHPRFGSEWTDEQRAKFILTSHQRQLEEKQMKMFIIKYDSEFKKFQATNKIK
jgi:hypothetical protein